MSSQSSHAAPLNRRSVAFWLLAAALPFFVLPSTPPSTPWGASNEVLALGSTAVVFAVVALSMGFFIRWTGLPTVATPGLWGIGAYAGALSIEHWGFEFWSATLFAVVVTGLVSIPVGLIAPAHERPRVLDRHPRLQRIHRSAVGQRRRPDHAACRACR